MFQDDALRQIGADRRAARLRDADNERLVRLAKADPEPKRRGAIGRTWMPLRHRAAGLLASVVR